MKGRKRQEHLLRAQAAGQIDAFGIVREQAQDFDEGDPGRVAQLERRVESLKLQIEQAGHGHPAAAARPGPGGAASRRAHETFRQVTRAKLARAETRSPRPFGSVSRAFGDGHFDVPDCPDCAAAGITSEESARIDHRPARQKCSSPPGQPCTCCFEGAGQADRVSRADREIDRLMRLGYSWETAQLAALPYGAGMAVR